MTFLRKHKRQKTAILCKDLPKLMLEERIIVVPNYKEKNGRELIVLPRSIYGHKVKRKKTIKL